MLSLHWQGRWQAMSDRGLLVEIFRRIHGLGGCNASESFSRGWDAAVASCEDVLTELTGISYDDLDGGGSDG